MTSPILRQAQDATLKVVGQSVARRDGLGHVTGKTQYIDDIQFRDMLHLKMVRSPIHHGLIKNIDFSEAAKVPGFVRALTWRDVPKNIYTILCLIGVGPDDEPVLAQDKVLWKGEQIAAILAETEEAAMEAASRVRLDLEELPAVFDVEEALQPGAPILKPWGTNHFIYDYEHGQANNCRKIRCGDVETAFAQADFIVETCYRTSPIEHAPTETTGCVVRPEPDGRYTVFTNTQALFFSLDNSALILQAPFNKLHFVGGTVGGGFGGKVDVIVEPIAILSAMKTGRPVKYRYSRDEEMRVSSTRAAWRMYYKDGVMKDGRIIARQVVSYHDAGAYNRHSPYAVTKHAANLTGPYSIPNVSIDAHCVYTNRQPSSAMRGFGVTPASFAIEAQMDKIAEVVGMDPWEIRFRNAYRNGDIRPYGKVVEDATLIEAMQAAAKLVGHELPEHLRAMSSWAADDSLSLSAAKEPKTKDEERNPSFVLRPSSSVPSSPGKLRGTGIAAVNYPTGMNLGGDPSQALIHATTTGTFVISLSSTDLGQGLKTVIAQIGAEALGVPFENVLIDTADTDTGPHCMGTFASRATHRVGNAVIQAAQEARKVMLEVAADELECAPEDLEPDGTGFVRVKGSPEHAIHIVDLALAAHFKYARTISGRGMFMKPKSGVDPDTGAMDPDSTEAHACTVAEVEVDTETGEVAVLSLKSAYEIGQQVNPELVKGQITGGSFMGMAHALYETTAPYYPLPDHNPGSFSDYILPGPAELPQIESVVLEYPSANGPFGVKGVGEMTANSPIPAIINAIHNATGVRLTEIPATPERVLRALESAR